MSNNTSNQNLASICFNHIKNDIIQAVLKPNQKLKVAYFQEKYSTAQSAIREALSRLVTCGLVEAVDNKGFRVASISINDINDVYQTFTQIEILALMQAIDKGNQAWHASIVAALYELEQIETKTSKIEFATWSLYNSKFHKALISGCNSPLLLTIRNDIYNRFDRYCNIAFSLAKKDLSINHAEHRELAQAVISGNKEKTEKIITHHINGPLNEVISILQKNNSI